MIVALLLMALMQDGPVQTAPPASAVDFSAYAEVVRAREAQAADKTAGDAADAEGPVLTAAEDCSVPGKRRPSETELECISRFRTDQWVRSVRPEQESAIDWEFSAERAAPVYPPVRTPGDCTVAANRGPDEDEFDCALRARRAPQGGEQVGRLGFRTGRADGEVPAWALSDPARWELSQCGAAGDDACRRQARNRLAMARAGVAAEPPATGSGASGDGQNCRMVMRRSESGFGGSLSRVCGDEGAVQDLLGRLDVPAQPRPEPCDRPGSLETQAAWIARCQALPVS